MDAGGDAALTAAALAGLLADDDRRRAFAALVLGASTMADVKRMTGLDGRGAGRALDRLAGAGLVVRDGKGHHFVVESAFAIAAREAAPAPSAGSTPGTRQSQRDRVLRAFVRDGRLTAIPTSRSKRQFVLDVLAQEFEPGRRYPEREVNRILRRWHDDTAALRRYLVDAGYMDREKGQYWRTGGSFLAD